jgi:hypothetical protein
MVLYHFAVSHSNPNPGNHGIFLYNLTTSAPVQPYPTFDGDSQAAYAFISQQIAASLETNLDLRALYGNATLYPPSSMLSKLDTLQAPAGVSADVWSAVSQQINTELNLLVRLLGYQVNFVQSGNAVSTVQTQRAIVAQDYLSKSTGSIWILAAFAGLTALSEVDDLSTAMGFFYSAAASLYGDGDVSGEFATIVAKLSEVTAISAGAAGSLYETIGPDWGKLQQFAQSIGAMTGSLNADQIAAAGNAYEIALYQALLPQTKAVVYFEGVNWELCALPNGFGLGNTPNDDGANGADQNLCARLGAIGASLTDIQSNQNGWKFDHWVCTSTRFGTSCARRGT